MIGEVSAPHARRATAALTMLVALAGVALTGVARADGDAATRSWATAQAMDLTRAGEIHEACAEQDSALRSYLEAVRFDATYGPAYLALGRLYEARGDPREADRAFSMGIDHVAGFFEALWGRGKLRAKHQRGDEAIADLEAAASLRPDALGVLRDLSGAYIAARALPAALAVARRRAALAEAQADATAATEARVEVRALEGLVGDVDPVQAGLRGRGSVRRALSVAARKR